MPNQATASNLPFYDIFTQQKVPLSKVSDDVIACDLWFVRTLQSKILGTSMLHTVPLIAERQAGKLRIPRTRAYRFSRQALSA